MICGNQILEHGIEQGNIIQGKAYLVLTSNDIIAGNGRVIKFYLFLLYGYICKKYI